MPPRGRWWEKGISLDCAAKIMLPANQIYLIRHGETAWCLTGQHTSHTDLPLTAEGERGASGLRRFLHGIRIAHVFTSPLRRARKTCELAGLGAQARLEPDLREWAYGDYEGRTTADIRMQMPGWNIFHEGCPHGETAAEIAARADVLLKRLRTLDGNIALFSHGQFLRVLAARWIGLSPEVGQHFVLGPAALSLLGYEHSSREVATISLWNVGPGLACGVD